MAQRTVTILSDDLDGKESADIETVQFGFDGATYEIDLSKKNRAAFEKALSPYLEAARKTAPSPRRSAPARRQAVTPDDRAWLRANGFPDIKDRGRLPKDATDALKRR
ncbi:histone-like nucleoid-structuring protein Lsr2 [Phycicoccus flavus]|uniref:histone-like nucleoid-structuring protein Lsr2 n=1 Tax=Phycicoccus flavus TaxID=2502783 RepID=UPI000FEBBD3A|nr:Lsr2 family protein [Phycicoccus flavus]NHA68222.1 Lsr2 family protein [Phycicoccus flavus]